MTRMIPSRSRTRHPKPTFVIIALMFLLSILAFVAFRFSPRTTTSSNSSMINNIIYTNTKDLVTHDFDAILVLGGGVPSSLYEPPIYVQKRCDDASIIRGSREIPILTLSAGTAHLPQLLTEDGLPMWESTSSAAYLQQKHKIHSHLYVETTSYDTIGNAFFARTSHTDIMKWRKLLVITNQVRTILYCTVLYCTVL